MSDCPVRVTCDWKAASGQATRQPQATRRTPKVLGTGYSVLLRVLQDRWRHRFATDIPHPQTARLRAALWRAAAGCRFETRRGRDVWSACWRATAIYVIGWAFPPPGTITLDRVGTSCRSKAVSSRRTPKSGVAAQQNRRLRPIALSKGSWRYVATGFVQEGVTPLIWILLKNPCF